MKIASPPMNTTQTITADVLAAMEADQMDLSVMPDMALKVRDMFDNPNVSAGHLVRLLSADPVISMHIIKATNSAALSWKT